MGRGGSYRRSAPMATPSSPKPPGCPGRPSSRPNKKLQRPRGLPTGRQRRPGVVANLERCDPTLVEDLDRLIDPATRGDPESPLRWTCKSTYHLAEAMQQQGHRHQSADRLSPVGDAGLLVAEQPQDGRRGRPPGSGRPVSVHLPAGEAFQRQGQPVISVDTKKKENVGNFSQGGQEWEPHGAAPKGRRRMTFGRRDEAKVNPYGVYDPDPESKAGSMSGSVTTRPNLRWPASGVGGGRWDRNGIRRPTKLLITADAGGQQWLSHSVMESGTPETGGRVAADHPVCHFPPGTSKWNKIEHRLFSFISKNWRGRPLDSLATVVNLISSTKTETGLSSKRRWTMPTMRKASR